MNLSTPLVWLARILPPAALAATVYLLRSSAKDATMWNTDRSVPGAARLKREESRAFLASVLNGLVTSVAAVAMIALGANPSLTSILFSLFFANITGFVMDALLVPDEGVDALFSGQWVGRVARRLGSWDFVRYCMTLLLDIALLTPVIDAVTGSNTLTALKTFLAQGAGYDRFVGANLDGMVATFLSLLGFYAFSQSTKSLWGYVSDAVPPHKRIQGSVIALAIAIASVGTLKSGPGLALTGLGGMAALALSGRLDKSDAEGPGNPLFGLVVGVAAAGVGLVAPFVL